MSGRMASFWLRASEIGLALLALLLPLGFLLRAYDAASLKTTLFEAGALILTGCWLAKGLERGRWELSAQALPAVLLAGLLAAWAVLRFFAAPTLACLPGLLDWLLGLSLFALAAIECSGARSAARFTCWLLAAAWVAGLYALLQRAGLDPLPWKGAFGASAFSTLGSPAALGLFAAVCAPLALSRLLDPEADAWVRRADAALLLVLGAATIATGSLEALAAFAFAGLASAATLPAFVPSRASVRAALGLLALSAVVAVASLTFGRGSIEEGWGRRASERRALWSACLPVLAEHPWVGAGPGRLALALDGHRPTGQQQRLERAPGTLVEMAAELGGVGVALWLWMFGCALWSAWQARQRLIQRAALEESAQLAGFTAALATWLVCSQWATAGQEPAVRWLAWPLAGFAAGLSTLGARGPIAVLPVALPLMARRRLAAASLLVAAVALVIPARWQASEVWLNGAVAAARRGDYAKAALLAQRADVLGAPHALEARYVAGSALLGAGCPAEALERLAALKADAPAFAQVQYLEGRAYLRLGRWRLAEAAFERQRSLDPTFVPALEGLATAAKESGHYQRARQTMLAAIALEPKDPVHWLALSDIYAREHRLSRARELQQRAVRLRRNADQRPPGRG